MSDTASGTSLYILDSSDTTEQSGQIGRGYTSFAHLGQINYINTYRLNLSVYGGSGGNFFWVSSLGDSTLSGVNLTLDSGSGDDTIDVAAFGHPFQMHVNGGAGVNRLNVGRSSTFPPSTRMAGMGRIRASPTTPRIFPPRP